jgi:hypothetical protein
LFSPLPVPNCPVSATQEALFYCSLEDLILGPLSETKMFK